MAHINVLLPRYMECRRGLTMRILSVRPFARLSVCLSNACIVTKPKKNLSKFFISCERSFSLLFREEEVGGGRPLLPDILGQSDRVGGKSPIFDLFSLVAPQP